MTEQEAIKEVKRWTNILMSAGSKCVSETAEAQDMAIKALEKIQEYHRMEERLKDVYGECDGLLGTFIEQSVGNAVSILENHDGVDIGHPYQSRLLTDEDVDKWEAYKAIGTPEEFRAAAEKQKADKKLESHDEKHILKSCLGIMQDMVDKFAEWYRWQHGEDSIEELDDEERFCIRTTYFRIVQKLFLLHTNHSGGTSTGEKCEQLGVDWSEEILLDWSDEE